MSSIWRDNKNNNNNTSFLQGGKILQHATANIFKSTNWVHSFWIYGGFIKLHKASNISSFLYTSKYLGHNSVRVFSHFLADFVDLINIGWFPGTYLNCEHNPQIYSWMEVKALEKLFWKLNIWCFVNPI